MLALNHMMPHLGKFDQDLQLTFSSSPGQRLNIIIIFPLLFFRCCLLFIFYSSKVGVEHPQFSCTCTMTRVVLFYSTVWKCHKVLDFGIQRSRIRRLHRFVLSVHHLLKLLPPHTT